MKINPLTRTGAVNPYNNQDLKAKDSSSPNGKRKDEVQISDEAKQLLVALNEVDRSTASEAKLQQLKQEVSSGTYHVDARTLAERMLPYLR